MSEQDPNKLCIPGGPGRPKNPTYAEMHPVQEWYVKIRNLTRKLSKSGKVAPQYIKALEMEAAALRTMGYSINLQEFAGVLGSVEVPPATPPPAPEVKMPDPVKIERPAVAAFDTEL